MAADMPPAIQFGCFLSVGFAVFAVCKYVLGPIVDFVSTTVTSVGSVTSVCTGSLQVILVALIDLFKMTSSNFLLLVGVVLTLSLILKAILEFWRVKGWKDLQEELQTRAENQLQRKELTWTSDRNDYEARKKELGDVKYAALDDKSSKLSELNRWLNERMEHIEEQSVQRNVLTDDISALEAFNLAQQQAAMVAARDRRQKDAKDSYKQQKQQLEEACQQKVKTLEEDIQKLEESFAEKQASEEKWIMELRNEIMDARKNQPASLSLMFGQSASLLDQPMAKLSLHMKAIWDER